jgi:hypothetical protein
VGSLLLYIAFSLLYGQIFGKAGVPKWKAWVPVVNLWKIYNLGGFGGYWLLIGLVPIVGTIPAAIVWWIAHFRIGRNFGQTGAFVLLAIIAQLIWAAIFGLAGWTWRPQYPVRGPQPLA